MGIVILAQDVALDRPVAIKLLPPKLAADAATRQRFLREAGTAASLSHPNIVPIHSVEEHDHLAFFVMGYVEGETLASRVHRNGSLPPSAAMKLLQEVAWALGHAHAKGIVHRDVKPENILIERASDRALVTDFGIAGAIDAACITPDGEVMGTALYISPEQALGRRLDARSDLYSLGVTAFFTLTGQLPFDGASAVSVVAKHVHDPPPPLATVRPDLSERLAAVVDRCLEKEPERRFETGEELALAIEEVGGRRVLIPLPISYFVRQALASGATVLTILSWLAAFAAFEFLLGDNDTRYVDALAWGVMLFVVVLGEAMMTLSFRAQGILRAGFTFADVQKGFLEDLKTQEEDVRSTVGWRGTNPLNRVWVGWPGQLFFALSSFGGNRSVGAPSLGASTEKLLSQSVAQLFGGLPQEDREEVHGLMGAVTTLEGQAEALRRREEMLVRAIDHVGADPVDSERTRLETIRRDPYRAHDVAPQQRRVEMLDDLQARQQELRERRATLMAVLERIRQGLVGVLDGAGPIDAVRRQLDVARELVREETAALTPYRDVAATQTAATGTD